jgi:hypothetical protein
MFESNNGYANKALGKCPGRNQRNKILMQQAAWVGYYLLV